MKQDKQIEKLVEELVGKLKFFADDYHHNVQSMVDTRPYSHEVLDLKPFKSFFYQALLKAKQIGVEEGGCEHCFCTKEIVYSPSESTSTATEIAIPHDKCCNCGIKRKSLTQHK